MLVGDPVAPVAYSWWVPTLGGLLVVLALAILAFALLWRPRGQRNREQAAPKVRRSFGQRLAGLYKEFQSGACDLREFHLLLAALLREFGSARFGRDVTAMSRAEVEVTYPGQGIGMLLARCEQPSFAKDSEAEGETSFHLAQEVIAQW